MSSVFHRLAALSLIALLIGVVIQPSSATALFHAASTVAYAQAHVLAQPTAIGYPPPAPTDTPAPGTPTNTPAPPTNTPTLTPTTDPNAYPPPPQPTDDPYPGPGTPTWTPSPTLTPSPVPTGPFQEQGGQVVFEAEHYANIISRSGHAWNTQTAVAGYVGSGFMRAEPNDGANIDTSYTTTSPELQYQVQFASTGTYYVWLRSENDAGTDDSVHVGLDGQAVSTADRMSLSTRLAWAWFQGTMDGPVATLTIASAGQHTINVWMREDGFRLDRLLLTTSATFVPSGNGPAESPRAGGGAPTATPVPPTVTPTSGATATPTPNSATRLRTVTLENSSLTDATTGFSTTSGTVSRETSSPIKGVGSFRVPNVTSGYGTISIADTDEVFVSAYIRWTAASSGGPRILRIVNRTSGGGTTTAGNIVLNSDGTLKLRNGSTNIGSVSSALTAGTVYRIGVHQKRGSGSNAVLEAYLATGDAPFGSPFAQSTSQNLTTAVTRIEVGATNGVQLDAVFDDIAVDTAAFAPPSP